MMMQYITDIQRNISYEQQSIVTKFGFLEAS